MALGYLDVELTRENFKKYYALFKCKQCGKCCNGLRGGVLLYPDEIPRLADKAHLSKRQFKDRHTYVKDGKRFLNLPCLFYKDGCSIYPDRPEVCMEYPLNKTYVKDSKHYMTVGMACPAGKELADKYAVKVVA